MLKISSKVPVWAHIIWIYTAIALSAGMLLLLDSQSAQTRISSLPGVFTLNFLRPHPPAEGDLRIWRDRDFVAMNSRFEALNTTFPKDLIKAIAWVESEWNHLNPAGRVFHTVNYHAKAAGGWRTSRDWGLMQINERMDSLNRREWNLERIKADPEYNLQAGLAVLESKQAYVKSLKRRRNWKAIEARYRLKGHSDLEIALKAYNGFQPSWSYLYRIKAALAEKPWEKAMLQQVLDGALHPETSYAYAGGAPWRFLGNPDFRDLRSARGGRLTVLDADTSAPYLYRLDLSRR